MDFWRALEELIGQSRVVIDRPRGSCHPRYPHLVYPVDYGYLADTRSMDGGGIDLWRGSGPDGRLNAVICTVDLVKRDSEIKLLLGCTEDELCRVEAFHNNSDLMKGLLMRRAE